MTAASRVVSVMVLLVAGLSGADTAAQAQNQPAQPVPEPIADRPFAGPYFVTQQYRDLLGREPEAGGVAFWVDRLASDTSAPTLVEQFVSSPEFAGTRAPVARLYLAAFGRLPDNEGWQFWSAQAANGRTLRSLATAFLATPEGRANFGGITDVETVETLYRNVLGREADRTGLDYWLERLASGSSQAELLLAFSESREFRLSSSAEIRAALLYSGLLGRTPDPDGLDFWQARLEAGASYAAVVDGFLRSDEYQDRLSGLWCRFVEVTRYEHLDGNQQDAQWQRLADTARSIYPLVSDSNGETTVEEYLGLRIDRSPDPRVVVAIGGDVERVCLTLLSAASHPESVTFVAKPYVLSQLRTADREVSQFLEANDVSFYASGVSFGLNVELAGTAEPRANEIIDRWGSFVEELRVGVFPYPMPDPPWPPWCHPWRDDAVDPATSGLALTTEVSAPTAPAGSNGLSYSVTATNVGTERLLVVVSSDVYEFVLGPTEPATGAPSASRILGNFGLPARDYILTPGASVTIEGPVGTEACDPSAGHRLAAGTYSLRGHLDVWVGDNPNQYEEEPDFVVQVPPIPVEITR